MNVFLRARNAPEIINSKNWLRAIAGYIRNRKSGRVKIGICRALLRVCRALLVALLVDM